MAQIEMRAGHGIEFTCPDCGEPLWMFVPDDGGPVEVIRRRDIPPESDSDEDEDA